MRVGTGAVKIIIRPMLLLLIFSIVGALITAAILLRDRSREVPSYGYVAPDTWRFETRHGARARAYVDANDTEGITQGTVDGSKGFRVRVSQAGAGPDSVYLRNAMNLDVNPTRHPMLLTFEARVTDPSPGGKPFPITFTVRDSATLLWGKKVQVGPNWERYEERMELPPSTLEHVIMAVHMGEQVGGVEVRNIRVIDAG